MSRFTQLTLLSILAITCCTTSASSSPLRGARVQNQVSHATYYDRYPTIFKLAASHFSHNTNNLTPALKVLSFGCSTGLEAQTLIEKYFPESIVFGVDIDDKTLATARLNNAQYSDRMFFFNGKKFDPVMFGPFDVIFANSVLTRNPAPLNFKETYPFELYNETITNLDAMLKPGGVLVIMNSNYHFHDTVTSRKYKILHNSHHTTQLCNDPKEGATSPPMQLLHPDSIGRYPHREEMVYCIHVKNDNA
jgi:SAM-dependent methyltransferase